MGNKQRNTTNNKEIRVIMLGLDAAGKTTILYKMKLGEVTTTIPTIGFNVETVEYGNMSLIVWDTGGKDKIRGLWRHYYPGTRALIWVVDSNDKVRIEDTRDELHRALKEDALRDVVVLIFANKQDLPNTLTAEEVQDRLGMTHLLEQTPEFLKSLAKGTLLQILPDGIIEIVAAYMPTKECRPYHVDYVQHWHLCQSGTLPNLLLSRQELGDQYWNIKHRICNIICSYVPPYNTELGTQTRCKVISSCATTGEGLYDGFAWLSSEISDLKLKQKNCNIL